MSKMKKAIKTKWLKALRSGKFHQGKDGLFFTATDAGKAYSTHCCLGVLRATCFPGTRKTNDNCFMWAGLLPQSTIDKAGLTFKQQETLAKMNDNGRSFEEIADFIEENL